MQMVWLRCCRRVFFEVCLNNLSPLAALPPQILFTLLISLANTFFIKQDTIPENNVFKSRGVFKPCVRPCPSHLELFVGAPPKAQGAAAGLGLPVSVSPPSFPGG